MRVAISDRKKLVVKKLFDIQPRNGGIFCLMLWKGIGCVSVELLQTFLGGFVLGL